MRYWLGVWMVLVLGGCGLKPTIEQSHSAHLTLRIPVLRLSDMAFVRQGVNFTNVQVFSAGKVVLDLRLGEDICLNGSCYDKTAFNRYFLGDPHYPELMEAILHKQPIYNRQHLTLTPEGFTQEIPLRGRTLWYEVSQKQSLFRDQERGVLVRLLWQ